MAATTAAAASPPASASSAVFTVPTEEIAEFADVPAPGLCLFVKSSWSAGLRTGMPAAPEAVLCRLLACDGERCWEGSLRRGDLAGPLGESWTDPSNLRLLVDALAAKGSASPCAVEVGGGLAAGTDFGTCAAVADAGIATLLAAAGGEGGPAPTMRRAATDANMTAGRQGRAGSTILRTFTQGATMAGGQRSTGAAAAEAIWSCSREDGQVGEAPLQLVVRFNYREGPVVAVRGVRLPSASLSAGLSCFFSLAYGSQMAASACVLAAEGERAVMVKRRDELQNQLDMLPAELEAEEERLLDAFVKALNAQKRRCRRLWQTRQLERCGGVAVFDGDLPPLAPATASLSECLDREDPPEVPCEPNGGVERDWFAAPGVGLATQCSLTFASQLPPATFGAALEKPEAGHGSAFTIPLTLGMCDYGASIAQGSAVMRGTASRPMVEGPTLTLGKRKR